ncbi:hypothetical protein DF186_20615, partial [Enterococcus hirae]
LELDLVKCKTFCVNGATSTLDVVGDQLGRKCRKFQDFRGCTQAQGRKLGKIKSYGPENYWSKSAPQRQVRFEATRLALENLPP